MWDCIINVGMHICISVCVCVCVCVCVFMRGKFVYVCVQEERKRETVSGIFFVPVIRSCLFSPTSH